MQRRHVERVDVRPFLAIDLHVDEQIVHLRRDRRVLERLVRHDMAPVTGGIADRQQDRPVAALRLRQRLRPPGPPVDGVAGVLQQIGRGRAGEPVSFLRHDGLRGALAGQDGRAVAAAQGAADRAQRSGVVDPFEFPELAGSGMAGSGRLLAKPNTLRSASSVLAGCQPIGRATAADAPFIAG
jgi:hypothetical protein